MRRNGCPVFSSLSTLSVRLLSPVPHSSSCQRESPFSTLKSWAVSSWENPKLERISKNRSLRICFVHRVCLVFMLFVFCVWLDGNRLAPSLILQTIPQTRKNLHKISPTEKKSFKFIRCLTAFASSCIVIIPCFLSLATPCHAHPKSPHAMIPREQRKLDGSHPREPVSL